MTAQFRWADGTVTKAAIQADTTAPLSGWTYFGRPWTVDVAPVIDRFNEERIALDGSIAELGKINFTVSIIVASAAMYDYIQDTYFPTGARTAPQTLQVYDLPSYSAQWIVVNCTGRSPGRKASLLNPRAGLLPYLTYTFFNGVIAAAS